MKAMYRVALMAPAVRLLLTNVPVHASEVDDSVRIIDQEVVCVQDLP